MKRLAFILFACLSLHVGYAQTAADKEIAQPKNMLSLNILGTGTYVGIAYERFLKDRLSVEASLGFIGVGAGMTFYPFKKIAVGELNPFLGLKTTYNTMGSGGEKSITYLPFGMTYFTKKKLSISADFGPAYWVNLSPFGKVTQEVSAQYPNANIRVFGNLKIGLWF